MTTTDLTREQIGRLKEEIENLKVFIKINGPDIDTAIGPMYCPDERWDDDYPELEELYQSLLNYLNG